MWPGYTLIRNTIRDNTLIRTPENRFSNVDPFELDPLDTVVVLGGGTGASKGRDPQFAPSGDRVGSAARLYHAGYGQRIVVTGKQIESRSIGTAEDPAVQAAALLTQPGVPPDRVSMLGGRNPFEEIWT